MVSNLVETNLRNKLATEEELLRLVDVERGAPEVDPDNMKQVSALPLGSCVSMDGWTNELKLILPESIELRSAREKLASRSRLLWFDSNDGMRPQAPRKI